MPTEREWAAAYLAQSRADLSALRRLQALEPSASAMLLQMSLEKLAKAALLRCGGMSIELARRTHKAAVAMVQLLARDTRRARRVGWRADVLQQKLVVLVEELERAQPSVAGVAMPCLEYPWQDSGGQVRWPAEHLPLLRWFRPRTGGDGPFVVRFTCDLADRFDAVFP